ncbi:MAG: hypothetical protein CMH64_02460 [Nanoarchaeota archaeon]|nr:hypothetical protein [Nanoarchaeota archaeon]|tara:strand:- start:3892 stop:4233 length:342 start_codon:yes stop_codon:yes gene_type:complete
MGLKEYGNSYKVCNKYRVMEDIVSQEEIDATLSGHIAEMEASGESVDFSLAVSSLMEFNENAILQQRISEARDSYQETERNFTQSFSEGGMNLNAYNESIMLIIAITLDWLLN